MRGNQQRTGAAPGGKPPAAGAAHPGMKPGVHPGMKGGANADGYLPGYGTNAAPAKAAEDQNQAVKKRSKSRQSAAGADSVTFR